MYKTNAIYYKFDIFEFNGIFKFYKFKLEWTLPRSLSRRFATSDSSVVCERICYDVNPETINSKYLIPNELAKIREILFICFIHRINMTRPNVFNVTISAFATCSPTSWTYLSQYSFEISSYRNESKLWLKQNEIRRWNFIWNGYKSSFFYSIAFVMK